MTHLPPCRTAALGAVALALGACDARVDLGSSAVRMDAASARDADAATTATALGDTCDGALGGCATSTCPTARVTIAEGPTVAPQSVLHLSGSGSVADVGRAVAAWRWTVDAPDGSASGFYPSADVPMPIFVANVAGTYRFHLAVSDDLGIASCAVAEAVVAVVPAKELHVELTWSTPGDANPDDAGATGTGVSLGSDLDLHVLHPGATEGPDVDGDGAVDGWFDPLFDVYWRNLHPPWGLPGGDDDPSLDRDDTDGAGPEIMTLAAPEAGVCYTVAVHVWDDWSFGPSDATVRIFAHGTLVFAPAAVRLERGDLWQVARFCWPLGGEPIRPLGCPADASTCAPEILQGYPVPEGITPLGR